MRTIKKQAYDAKKQPKQEIEGLFQSLLTVYGRYRMHVQAATAAVLILLIALGGYSLYRNSSERKASALLAPALDLYSSPQPDLEKAAELFRDVRKEYPRTLSGSIARYYEGNCLADRGRMQEALELYREVVKRRGAGNILPAMAYQRMGYAYQALGNRDESIKAFEQAESLKGPGMATFELAKLYALSGNREASQKRYKMLTDSLPGTPLSEEAAKMIKKEPPSSPKGQEEGTKEP